MSGAPTKDECAIGSQTYVIEGADSNKYLKDLVLELNTKVLNTILETNTRDQSYALVFTALNLLHELKTLQGAAPDKAQSETESDNSEDSSKTLSEIPPDQMELFSYSNKNPNDSDGEPLYTGEEMNRIVLDVIEKLTGKVKEMKELL